MAAISGHLLIKGICRCRIRIVMELNDNLARDLEEKRLICEIKFSREEITLWREELFRIGENNAWREAPALAAVVTVGIGVHKYHEGEFWPSFHEVENTNDWGAQFENFIMGHRTLDSFRSMVEGGALKYVAPILAHGGIPQYYLTDYFGLVTKYSNPDESASDFLEFLSENPKLTNNIVKPVRRFLKEGGEAAEDFVARTLAIWQSRAEGDGGGNHGLPDRVVDKFSKWYEENAAKLQAQNSRKSRSPRPIIKMDPGGLWVYLQLPRCDDYSSVETAATWNFHGKEFATSREHQIPLSRAENWKISLGNQRTETPGISDREPALFFDSVTRKRIVNPRSRRLPENVWAIYRDDVEASPKPVFHEKLPGWSEFIVADFDLVDHKTLEIGEQHYEVRRPFFHVEDDPVVTGVSGIDGSPVFYEAPQIIWEGRANLSLSRNGNKERNVDITMEELTECFVDPAEYRFILRGPFGQNVRKQFVLIPGLRAVMDPKIIWPNTKHIKFELSSDRMQITNLNSGESPFYSFKPRMNFRAISKGVVIDLIAEVPTLQWRVILSEDEPSTWSSNLVTLKIEELQDANYPRLVCEIGELDSNIDLALVGKHGAVNPPQGQYSKISKSKWAFDLRVVIDQVTHSGRAEEFELKINGVNSHQQYCEPILTVRPHWNLYNFTVKPKSINGEHAIDLSWLENGPAAQGRYLVLIPVWRPWEVPDVHLLKDLETSRYQWQNSKITPGRYIVRAVHAEWGCDGDEWVSAEYICQEAADVNKESWPELFSGGSKKLNPIQSYTESLMAHWYRPELVDTAPQSPSNITSDHICEFLDYLDAANKVNPLKISKDGSGALTIFCENPQATSDAVGSVQNFPDLWQLVLPSLDIINLIPGKEDISFITELAFHFTNIDRAFKVIKRTHKKKLLSSSLQNWHANLGNQPPRPDEIIFLCEKFDLFASEGPGRRREYEDFKKIIQQRDAV